MHPIISPIRLLTADIRQYFKEQLRRDFIELVPNPKKSDTAHYIPHHPVNKNSDTTPVGIVYDCSCHQSSEHPSLNDCLLTGPPFLVDLCAIILRFRKYQYGLITDIEKAFLHITLNEKDRNFTRFLWLSDPLDPNSEFVQTNIVWCSEFPLYIVRDITSSFATV